MTHRAPAPAAPRAAGPVLRPAGPPPSGTISAVLASAAEIIQHNGLHQGDFLDYEAAEEEGRDVRQVPVCTVGAIRIAAGADPDDIGAPVPAIAAFADWLTTSGPPMPTRHASQLTPATDLADDAVSQVGLWNDDAARNAPQVIAALRQAAEAVMA
jgi:hypothetical protein